MSESFHTFQTTSPRELLAMPLQFVKGVGPVRAGLLARLNLLTMQDLLYHFPVAHKDRATVTPIAKLRAGTDVNIVAQIIDVRGKRYNGKEKIEALLGDATGQIRAVWWSPWVASKLDPDCWSVLFRQKRHFAGNRIELAQPGIRSDQRARRTPQTPLSPRGRGEFDDRPQPRPHRAGLQPAAETAARQRRRSAGNPHQPEFLAQTRLASAGSRRGGTARRPVAGGAAPKNKIAATGRSDPAISFPEILVRAAAVARKRLVYEELFIVALGVALRRAQIERLSASKEMPLTPGIEKRIAARLPFTLTPSQQSAFKEIAADAGRRNIR